MNGFSPISVKESPVALSPGRNLTGAPRVSRDIIADVYNTVQKWNDYHIKGAKLVKEIASIKGNDPNNYSDELQKLTRDLFELVRNCSVISEEISSFFHRMQSLSKLHKEEGCLFISLSVEKMAAMIKTVYEAYTKELRNKQLVLENIAHSESESEAMFFAALWTYQIYITSNITITLEALLTETGHRKIT